MSKWRVYLRQCEEITSIVNIGAIARPKINLICHKVFEHYFKNEYDLIKRNAEYDKQKEMEYKKQEI